VATIGFEKVTKRFDDGTVAVDAIDLEVVDGEFVVLVGPSGSGKSTMLRMLAGLEEISSGVIRIDGKAVNGVEPKDRDIAMVFQNYALYPHMSVFGNMDLGLRLRHMPKAERKIRIGETAALLGIDDLLHRRPSQLSGGQRQRVAMGRALVREPKVFLLDEPLSNLDAKLRVQMRVEISRIHQRVRTTTVYVTHDQTEAMTMGDRVAVMRAGRIEQIDAPQALYQHPVNVFVASFIGSPSMNLWLGGLEPTDGSANVAVGSQRIRLPAEALAANPALRSRLGSRLIVGIRPEDLNDAALQPSDNKIVLDAVVAVAEPMGAEVIVHFEIDADTVKEPSGRRRPDGEPKSDNGVMFTARLDPETRAADGTTLKLAVDTKRLYFFDPDTGAAIR
jgi:multiple sugar transport system ATP-binding protein